MAKPKQFTNEQIITALENGDGYITKAAEDLGCCYQTISKYIEDEDEIKDALVAMNEKNIDHVESKLMERINGVTCMKHDKDGEEIIYTLPPDVTSIIFFLKCKGKKRGYVERQEITGKDGGALEFKDTGVRSKVEGLLDGLSKSEKKKEGP